MKQQAEAKFQIKKGDENIYSEVSGGPKLTQGHFVMEYHGDIKGEGVLTEIKIYHSDNHASIFGFERITGSVKGKKGSFVLEHIGKFEDGVIKSIRTVVEDSATGELSGLRGEIIFISNQAKEFEITLNYSFSEKA